MLANSPPSLSVTVGAGEAYELFCGFTSNLSLRPRPLALKGRAALPFRSMGVGSYESKVEFIIKNLGKNFKRTLGEG